MFTSDNFVLVLCFSDVLCPNVHVEGDGFKHTSGGTDEIPGKEKQFSAVHLGTEIV